MPFFSIIIPTYNSGAHLQKAIESITSQTFNDYEILFVDGMSKDNTLDIVEAFKLLYPASVRYISEADRGIYDAMNKGINLITGDWVYFMGSDDRLYSPGVLHDIYHEIKKTPADLVYGNVTGENSLRRYVYDTESKVLSTGIHHQSVFYKKLVFETTGNYDPFFKVAADYHLTLKVICNPGFKIRYVDLDIAHYGEGGLSSNTFDYTFFSYHYKFLAQQNALSKIDDSSKCLDASIYCCLHLAKEKMNIGFAWKNLLYYTFADYSLNLTLKFKNLLRMLRWTLTATDDN